MPDARDREDVRVRAAVAVLGGEDPAAVAGRFGLDVRLVRRWTGQFRRAGAAAVRNEPVGDELRARDRLLAAINHELRTPLTKVRAITSLLERGDIDAATAAELRDELRAQFQHLDQLLHRLDETTGASLGRLLLERRPVTLAGLLEPLDVAVEADDATIDVDERRLRTVVADLVDVARGGPDTTDVHVLATVEDDWCEITVVRHGAPFDPSRLAAYLDPFAPRDDHSDVTFGLHLATALTVLHGGHLGVRRVGGRDEFWIRLPVGPPADDLSVVALQH